MASKSFLFWDITSCSLLKVKEPALNQVAKRDCFPPAFTLDFYLAYSLTLNMEAICSSETSVDFQRNTRRYNPEDITLHNHRCENLKSYILSRVKAVTLDGVGLTTGFIGFTHNYSVPTTVELHTRLHFTVFSGNGSSACVPLHCLGWVSPGPRTSCRPDSSSLTGHQLTDSVSPLDWLPSQLPPSYIVWDRTP
jgi:hypothetical protein